MINRRTIIRPIVLAIMFVTVAGSVRAASVDLTANIVGSLPRPLLIGSLGAAEGGLLFHTWYSNTSEVSIIDISNTASMSRVSYVGRPRTHTAFSNFHMVKSGNYAFIADSNEIMKFDIGIPSAPVLRDSFFLPTRLMSIHLFRDSLYLIHIDNSTFDGVLSMLYANTTQHLTAARTVQGFYLPGQDAFTFGGDKFLVFLPNYVYIWRLPVTDGNSPAYTFTVGDNSRFFCVKNGFGFSTIDSGVQVLDMRNLNTVTPIDTIRCGFNPTDMDVYKNLLIVCSNVRNHLYIYDVDTISAIAEVAHYNGVVSQATVDSARAYLFAAAGAPSLVAFNIAGLVQEPPNTPPAFAGATDSITVTENTTATWKARATDADNDPVTFTFENLPAWATRTSDSTLSLSPVHASASVFIRVIAADNRGGRDTLTLHVLVDHPIGITARQRPVARPRTAGALLVGLDGRIATSRNARTPHGVYFMKTTDGSSVARIVVPGR